MPSGDVQERQPCPIKRPEVCTIYMQCTIFVLSSIFGLAVPDPIIIYPKILIIHILGYMMID